MREKATRGPNAVLGRGGSLRSASLPAAHTVVAARRLTPDPERVRIILLYVHLLANPPPQHTAFAECIHFYVCFLSEMAYRGGRREGGAFFTTVARSVEALLGGEVSR